MLVVTFLNYIRITLGAMHELYRTYCFGAPASNGRIIEQGWFPFVILGDVQAQLAHANRTII